MPHWVFWYIHHHTPPFHQFVYALICCLPQQKKSSSHVYWLFHLEMCIIIFVLLMPAPCQGMWHLLVDSALSLSVGICCMHIEAPYRKSFIACVYRSPSLVCLYFTNFAVMVCNGAQLKCKEILPGVWDKFGYKWSQNVCQDTHRNANPTPYQWSQDDH